MAQPQMNFNPGQVFRLLWHFPKFVKLYWRLFKDARVPGRAKAILLAAVLYLISPFDLLPDFVHPLFGRVDDLAILFFGARWFISLCPPDVVQEQVKIISQE